MKISNLTASLIAPALFAIGMAALTGCSKGGDNASADPAAAPSLSSALSPEKAKEAVAEQRRSALTKADPSTPLESYFPLKSGNELMFMYYALSGIPPEMEKIAAKYSSEYRQSSDAFRKQDLLTALKPRIENELEMAKTRRYFIYEIEQNLQHYDFDKKQFPLQNGLQPDSYWYMYDNSDYKVEFTNVEPFQRLNVADETKARGIEKMVSGYKQFTLRIYAFAQDVDINSSRLKAQVVKVVLLDQQDNELVTQ
ncbi:MAG: DUF4852 domain-containing protein [Stagnimonas sp.]|nr:DUF4852 domain-containing protein [Stagnimonas sp.]